MFAQRLVVGVRPLCHARSWCNVLTQYAPPCPLVLTVAIRRVEIAYSQRVNQLIFFY